MEVKPGYKQTEVGVIPEEWASTRLGECARFRTGPFGSALHKSDYTNDGIPVVNPMHLVNGGIEPTRTMTITEEAANNLADFRLKAGEIVMGRRGDMGRCAVVQPLQAGWLCGTGSMIIRCESVADPEFLQRVLSSPQAISAIEDASVGTTMINLNQGALAGLKIQLPPLPEQRAIATALSDVDGLLGGLDRLIAKKRDLKQAAMQQLLTGQTRLPGFHGEWEVKRLGEVLKVRHGKSQHGITVSDGEYPILASGGEIGRTNTALYDKPSVLIGRKGTIDSPQYADTPFWTVDTLFFTEISAGAEAKFVFYKFTMIPWRSYNEASGVPSLNAKTIESIEALFPPMKAEQTAIAEVLSEMDGELALLEQRREKTRALKQAMMQELLTGRTRLL